MAQKNDYINNKKNYWKWIDWMVYGDNSGSLEESEVNG